MATLPPPHLLLGSLSLLAACANHPPGAPVVAIFPPDPRTADDLEAAVVFPARDDDGDAVGYRFTWLRDGAPYDDLVDSAVVPEALTREVETWSVLLTASDGELDGEPAQAAVTVGNTPPGVVGILSPASPTGDDDLVAVVETLDPDEDPVRLAWAWAVDGVATDLDGDTVPADATSPGETWSVRVVPDDGQEEGAALELSVTIAGQEAGG